MKKALLVGILVVTGPIYAFATSASLQASPPIHFSIKNKIPGLVFEQVTLAPRLVCSTTYPEWGGEATTHSNAAPLIVSDNVNLQDPTHMRFSVQIMEPASMSAPPKQGLASKSSCHAGLSFFFKIKGEKYYPFGSNDGSDYFINNLGSVSSKGENKDLTGKFANELSGTYELALAKGGTVYDNEAGGQVPYCQIVLKKGSAEIGRAMQFRGKGEICNQAK